MSVTTTRSMDDSDKKTATQARDTNHNHLDNSRITGSIFLDAEFKVLEVSQSIERLLHLPKSLIGSNLPKYIKRVHSPSTTDNEIADGGEEMLAKALKSGRPRHFYLELDNEGEHFWLMVEVVKIAAHSDAGAVLQLTVVDVSKMKRQEELLHRQLKEISDQNRQWQAIYGSMLESIVLLDVNGRVISMNPATEKITGVKTSEGIGKHVRELFPKVDATVPGLDLQGRSGLDQTLEEQRPSDLYEAVVATRDGKHIWINYTYTPLRDPNGEITALVRVTSDVSTVKAVEQMKNDFVSIASHELRTPLGVINSYLNLFLHGQLGELTDAQRVYIKRVHDASNDMSALVEDLLNMSRIESGRLELARQQFELRELLDDVLSHLDQKIDTKRISIRINEPKEAIKVHADRQKLDQALTNIIDNAIKYTYDNGRITVSIKRDKTSVLISVRDSGVGIRPENLGHIFEKFYRESNPLSVKEGGSGLGLYISRKLVELHGGTIAATSKLHSGSTFSIRLPLTPHQ